MSTSDATFERPSAAMGGAPPDRRSQVGGAEGDDEAATPDDDGVVGPEVEIVRVPMDRAASLWLISVPPPTLRAGEVEEHGPEIGRGAARTMFTPSVGVVLPSDIGEIEGRAGWVETLPSAPQDLPM